MRQVPKNYKYLVVGNGRMADFIIKALSAVESQIATWNRQTQDNETLKSLAHQSQFTLLCVNDSSILPLSIELADIQTQCVHFSGALEVNKVYGFHPLMTFSKQKPINNSDSSFPFVGSLPEEIFRFVFPSFKNPYVRILEEQRALYHGLCVLGGNGTTLLWELVGKEFIKLGLSQKDIKPFIAQTADNILEETADRFTGPWYRGDIKTVEKHQEQFKKTSLKTIYDELNKLSQTLDGSI